MSCEFKTTQNVFYLMKLKFTRGDSPIKVTGMVVVSLRDVNCGF